MSIGQYTNLFEQLDLTGSLFEMLGILKILRAERVYLVENEIFSAQIMTYKLTTPSDTELKKTFGSVL